MAKYAVIRRPPASRCASRTRKRNPSRTWTAGPSGSLRGRAVRAARRRLPVPDCRLAGRPGDVPPRRHAPNMAFMDISIVDGGAERFEFARQRSGQVKPEALFRRRPRRRPPVRHRRASGRRLCKGRPGRGRHPGRAGDGHDQGSGTPTSTTSRRPCRAGASGSQTPAGLPQGNHSRG